MSPSKPPDIAQIGRTPNTPGTLHTFYDPNRFHRFLRCVPRITSLNRYNVTYFAVANALNHVVPCVGAVPWSFTAAVCA